MLPNFHVDFFSDSRYEYLTAEISFKNQILCQVSMDNGIQNMEIEFFHEQRVLSSPPEMKFPLKELFALIEEVRQELIEVYQNQESCSD